ncbi:carotenoid cleavage dioxygenase 8 homolog A, chloroplastic-like [Triticum urartu]|nr:carotenoid cleavage dioxygenase 8 homolog A, chloroplastic-like [Triticum urartu]
MAAAALPALCTAPKPLALSLPRSTPINLRRSKMVGSPARSVKAATTTSTPVEEEAAAGVDGGGTKLSAWTSVRQERWEGELAVEGDLPLWLNGTYLRNGPGVWDAGDVAFHHLFDGYATLVRVSFSHGHATGAHRQIESDAYMAAKKHGQPVLREFSQCPEPGTLLDRVRDAVGLLSGAALTDNPNSAVLPLGDGRVMCLTETTKSSVLIDPHTLDTVGKFKFTGKVGANAMIQSAHPIVTESEFLTLLPDLVRPGHLLVRMEAGSNERKVVGRVDCRGGPTPGWMHAFAVTEKYVVVPEMQLRYSSTSLLKSELARFYAFDWLPASGSYMHVMCRSTGKTVASVEVPPFMAIHFINAYEEVGEEGQAAQVIVDCCEHYGDPAIIETLVLQGLRSFRGTDTLPDARVGRFRIPLDGSPSGELQTALDPEEHGRGMDMCNINRARLGKKYRYAYACGARRPCNFPNTLTKIDLVLRKAMSWHEEGAVPSEPFFVARPGATDEDDGVVMSIVSAEDGGGFMVVLHAATFKEIARVRFPYGLPYGFHGCWIPAKN